MIDYAKKLLNIILIIIRLLLAILLVKNIKLMKNEYDIYIVEQWWLVHRNYKIPKMLRRKCLFLIYETHSIFYTLYEYAKVQSV